MRWGWELIIMLGNNNAIDWRNNDAGFHGCHVGQPSKIIMRANNATWLLGPGPDQSSSTIIFLIRPCSLRLGPYWAPKLSKQYENKWFPAIFGAPDRAADTPAEVRGGGDGSEKVHAHSEICGIPARPEKVLTAPPPLPFLQRPAITDQLTGIFRIVKDFPSWRILLRIY